MLKIYLFFCVLFILGCENKEIPVGIDEPQDLIFHECRNECNCDMDHCPGYEEPAQGRYEIIYYKDYSYGAEIEYPHTFENGCTIDMKGKISVIPFERKSLIYFWEYYGVIYFDMLLEIVCPTYTYYKQENFWYWYWGLCEPTYFLCGMVFFENLGALKNDVGVGGNLYYPGEIMSMLINLDTSHGDKIFFYTESEKIGEVGDCLDEPSYHCYFNPDCTDLIADCVGSKETCQKIGGLSMARHKPDHKNEICHAFF